MNKVFQHIGELFKGAGIEDFSTLPEGKEEKAPLLRRSKS